MQAYSNPKLADSPTALPDVEYWHHPGGFLSGEPGDGEEFEAGWYWWSCLPGCLPDGEPHGPFATEAECIADFTEEDPS